MTDNEWEALTIGILIGGIIVNLVWILILL
jgi:hypothetical protein